MRKLKLILILTALFACFGTALAQQKPADAQSSFVDFTGFKGKIFELKYRSPEEISDVLRTLSSGFKGAAISSNRELRTITVRDFPENIAAIEEAIKRLDVPKTPRPTADIEVTAYVLIASTTETGNGVLPSNLKNVVTQLQNTLAFKNYRLLTTVIQRSKLGGSRNESGNINSKGTAVMGEQNLSANYQFRVNGIWADARENAATAINFENLVFSLSGVTPDDQRQIGLGEIQTQLTSRDGETVVVGTASLKDKGLILVLSNKIIK